MYNCSGICRALHFHLIKQRYKKEYRDIMKFLPKYAQEKAGLPEVATYTSVAYFIGSIQTDCYIDAKFKNVMELQKLFTVICSDPTMKNLKVCKGVSAILKPLLVLFFKCIFSIFFNRPINLTLSKDLCNLLRSLSKTSYTLTYNAYNDLLRQSSLGYHKLFAQAEFAPIYRHECKSLSYFLAHFDTMKKDHERYYANLKEALENDEVEAGYYECCELAYNLKSYERLDHMRMNRWNSGNFMKRYIAYHEDWKHI